MWYSADIGKYSDKQPYGLTEIWEYILSSKNIVSIKWYCCTVLHKYFYLMKYVGEL